MLADSAGASQGRDINGPTALMHSVLRIPVGDYLLTGVALNLRFLPSTFQTAREHVRMLFCVFFKQGGMQLQVDVCDVAMLREAQAQRRPEEFRGLIVRVGGYSDYFTLLSPALQNEIIARTAQEIGA